MKQGSNVEGDYETRLGNSFKGDSGMKSDNSIEGEEIQQDYLEKAAQVYTKTNSIRAAAKELGISPMKVRKALITYGLYRNETSDTVGTEYEQKLQKGISSRDAVVEIGNELGMTPANVYAYLPYQRIAYNTDEKSHAAQKQAEYRERAAAGMTQKGKELLSEQRIQKLVKEHLFADPHGNWHEDKTKEASGHQHGAELILTGGSANGERFIIECKGKSYAQSADAINKEGWLNALGQIVTRMDSKRTIASGKTMGKVSTAYKYGLGLYWVSAQVALRRIPHEIAKTMNLYIFSVDDDGFVRKWTPSQIGKRYEEKEFHRN